MCTAEVVEGLIHLTLIVQVGHSPGEGVGLTHEVAVPGASRPVLPPPFILKSLSAETRESYRRGIKEFFRHAGWPHPTQVTQEHVLRYRDRLIWDKRRPATVAQKLSVVRSFFSYLQAAGVVTLNPASAKLVPPPPVPAQQAGRALTPKEVRHLLASPDKTKPEGARDYALLLVMLRLSL
jgi:integrase/recombinase XerD